MMLLVEVSEIAGEKELVLRFTCRTCSDTEESRELLVAFPAAALGDV